ncbi:FAD-binding oxidoreductase [Alicyclobacillus sp. SO9]|uniref:FAD-binding oxidoreductase n=1 Tax=Alicyclobacillus sp. SO9 TaxID=2665646 RepID=UPI0018E87FE4|nr:FAD-linked oxidase C-terminal domain-containing protein [Alicyclobacillus sp. SO9]QQE77508.1 FAD-binding protein [Alicyclobacillus sp. SO9]
MNWIGDLTALLGTSKVTDNETVLQHHSHDESYHQAVLPDVVVFPESTDDIVQVLQFANYHRIPVVPFGAGSSLEGHTVPVQHGISVDLTNMHQILEIRPNDFLACVEPGVTRKQLNEQLRRFGLFFPVDPGADATIGGMAATGASGTTTVRYGAMRDNVRSLTVVLADGRVIETGSLASKSSSGYNLTHLFVGSEGTLGVISKIWLRLYGLPQKEVAARAQFHSVAECVNASVALISAGIPAARLELVSPRIMNAINQYSHTSYDEVPTLFIAFHGNEGSIDTDVALAQEILTDEGCITVDFESETDARNTLWSARHTAAPAFMHQHPGKGHMTTDVCVPLSKLPAAISFAEQMMAEYNVEGGIVGHVGDGNFHVSMAVNPQDSEQLKRAEAFNEALVKHALEAGGTCTGEHGVGLGKKKYQSLEHGDALDVMRSIKFALDKLGIMNPGKLVDTDK